MPLKEIKSVKITSKGQISIPLIARDKAGFKEGSSVAVLVYDDHVELRPMKQISERMETMMLSESSFAKEWNTKEEDEAWKDL
jgi:AbrB family looped-hinge helix DNA binding protein